MDFVQKTVPSYGFFVEIEDKALCEDKALYFFSSMADGAKLSITIDNGLWAPPCCFYIITT